MATDVRELLATSDHGLKPDKSYHWGAYCLVQFDQNNALSRISFLAEFPPSLAVEKLFVGMSMEEALALHPDLKFMRLNVASSEEYEGGTIADGFALSLRAQDGVVRAFDISSLEEARAQEARQVTAEARMEARRQERARSVRWKQIEDPDAMLDDWASHSLPSGDWPKLFRAYAAWLKRATPDERHQAACAWNWDYGVAPLLWMIRQPDCDRATAMQIFYDAEPSFYRQFGNDRSQVSSGFQETFDLIVEIRRRLSANFFTRSEIAFDGSRHFRKHFDAKSEDLALASVLPGRSLPYREFADGLPAEIYSVLR